MKKTVLVAISIIFISALFCGCTTNNSNSNNDNTGEVSSDDDNQDYVNQMFLNWVHETRNDLANSRLSIAESLNGLNMNPDVNEASKNHESYETVKDLARNHQSTAGSATYYLDDPSRYSDGYKSLRYEFEKYLKAEKEYGDYLARWGMDIAFYSGEESDTYLKLANEKDSQAKTYWNNCEDIIDDL